MEVTEQDLHFINRAIELGLQAEAAGNMPFGALIVRRNGRGGGAIIAEGQNRVFCPKLNPGAHAEIEAINKVDWAQMLGKEKELVLYTNIEPCIMCFGTIILHKVGRVVFGGSDLSKGAVCLKDKLGEIYKKEQLPEFVGPVNQEECLPMWIRANEIYCKYWDNSKP